jgi:hypothetical protein
MKSGHATTSRSEGTLPHGMSHQWLQPSLQRSGGDHGRFAASTAAITVPIVNS